MQFYFRSSSQAVYWCFILKNEHPCWTVSSLNIDYLCNFSFSRLKEDLFPHLVSLCFSMICQHIIWHCPMLQINVGQTGIVLPGPSDVVDLTCEIRILSGVSICLLRSHYYPSNMTTIFPYKVAIVLNCH